jgi:GNAT superfamily N-acetyltransferase
MVTCRVLTPAEVIKYGDFLKDRTDESKHIYFGISVSDFYIDQLIERILSDYSKHHIVVAEDEFLNIVGTIHIAHMSKSSVEFGVMVAESHRKLGISSNMMEYALTWCRNRGLNDIYMHCLGYNKPIIHLKSMDLKLLKIMAMLMLM